MTFHDKHGCTLGIGSDSMLPKLRNPTWCQRAIRALQKMIQVSEHHPLTFDVFRSYPTMVVERQRHVVEGGRCIIHPFSQFSLIWNSFMMFVNVAHMVVSSLRLCYYLNPSYPTFLKADYVLLALHILCLMDILIRLNTGYVEGSPANVVLDRRSIASNYLRHYFFPDLASCLPLTMILIALGCGIHYCFLIAHSLPVVCRATRIFSVVMDLRTLLQTMTKSIIVYRVVRHVLVYALIMHWFSCLIYLPPIINFYCYGSIPLGYNAFLGLKGQNRDITMVPVGERYLKALFISVSSFFGTGFSLVQVNLPAEILINSIVILLASMCMIYNVVFLLVTYLIVFNSSMQYQELMDQVEKYMRHKQFPLALKRRVRAYYDYRYQERYFKEERALQCLSEQLRNELSLHTCQNLLDKVAIFETLPPTFIGTLLACLKFEVCHLEDGDFFGAMALMVKDRKRFATVVAIEITQVYRLDADDFYGFVMDNRELFHHIEDQMMQRINKTVLVDDAYRREREWRASTGQNEPPARDARISSMADIHAVQAMEEQ
ncbi:potassium/sodium hyperpolarization-activated cyclic nucleotide-gated channel 1-like isoform X4 [Choristoneura fumiferana]|uniref:potassium/sodium hyperpolarization-activated cyclic nucleotide-gated channel 1-like isoform X4 n=1 Tax=Choristoneura fumiferana TaxID=7141 RepID=UPI003D15A9F8